MLISLFIPTFIGALSFFVLLLQVIDLFSNISQYINEEVPLKVILQIVIFYIPKAINTSLPMALLFSISYTMGNLYSNNELIAIFSSGIKLIRFVYPLILFGLILSIFGFYFDNKIVISTYSKKNELQDRALSVVKSFDNHNVALTNKSRNIIYYIKFYNDKNETLSDIIIIERDNLNNLVKRIDSKIAYWNNGVWEFNDALIYEKKDGVEHYTVTVEKKYMDEKLNLPPVSFKDPVKDISEMTLQESREWIQLLESTGKTQRALEAYMEYLKRYSMTLTPLIVAFLSCALGGKFKKNVLLMSLLSSLSISVCYYVFQMITVEISLRVEEIPALMGAWAPFIIFTVIGLVQFKNAKT
ncbi:MAG: LptF/LptG family permease [Spirochaetales bacterium]|nr:LptF/LptG family permease [Spirochaetales bacterium]